MTEKQWLACQEPNDLIVFLLQLGGRHQGRKFHLFACGCCRLCWHLLVDERSREAVEVGERLADDLATVEEIDRTRARSLRALAHFGHRSAKGRLAMVATRLLQAETGYAGIAAPLANSIREGFRSPRREAIAASQCDLIRDLIGNPFDTLSYDPAWVTPTVLELSRYIYNHREYEKMPFLGDALEEAGCAEPRILEHCRTAPLHARGCWVLDALTGRVEA